MVEDDFEKSPMPIHSGQLDFDEQSRKYYLEVTSPKSEKQNQTTYSYPKKTISEDAASQGAHLEYRLLHLAPTEI